VSGQRLRLTNWQKTVKAADLEPVVEPHELQWYCSLLGGLKWDDGDIKIEWEREK
jgi:hypothetical protein